MALIKCPECDIDVSDKATSCPRCGYPIAERVGINESSANASGGKSNSAGPGYLYCFIDSYYSNYDEWANSTERELVSKVQAQKLTPKGLKPFGSIRKFSHSDNLLSKEGFEEEIINELLQDGWMKIPNCVRFLCKKTNANPYHGWEFGYMNVRSHDVVGSGFLHRFLTSLKHYEVMSLELITPQGYIEISYSEPWNFYEKTKIAKKEKKEDWFKSLQKIGWVQISKEIYSDANRKGKQTIWARQNI